MLVIFYLLQPSLLLIFVHGGVGTSIVGQFFLTVFWVSAILYVLQITVVLCVIALGICCRNFR